MSNTAIVCCGVWYAIIDNTWCWYSYWCYKKSILKGKTFLLPCSTLACYRVFLCLLEKRCYNKDVEKERSRKWQKLIFKMVSGE